MNDTIELNGRTYTVETEYDDFMGAPWDEHDGHGIVSDWESRDKHAGEYVLSSDRNSKRFYDYAGTMKKAKAEGWGLSASAHAAECRRLGLDTLRLSPDKLRMLQSCRILNTCKAGVMMTGIGCTSRLRVQTVNGKRAADFPTMTMTA